MNVFTHDLFGLTSMTAGIINAPYVPTRLSDLGLFEEDGVATLDVWIEEENGVLTLLEVMPRGAPGQPVKNTKRNGRPFRIPHIPQQGQVLADEVIGVRAFGTQDQMKTIQQVRDKKLAIARRSLDYTIEAHRVQCLLGNYIDANNAARSLFNEFGVSQKAVAMDFSNADADQEEKHLAVMTNIEDALGELPFTGVRVFHGATSWANFVKNPSVKATYLNTPMAAELRVDPRTPREFGGMIHERYRGTGAVKIPDAEARAVPVGVPGLFITRFGPANTQAAVGTMGERYYAIPEPMEYDAGIKFLAQSNPLNLCTRPAAIIRLVAGASL